MKYAIPILLLLLTPPLAANETADKPVEITVKPLLCIVDLRTPGCEMTFLVQWESDESGYYCVFNDLEDAPLNCWTEQRSGELHDKRSVQENLSFWINESGGAPLDTVTVEVLRMDSDDRRRRRRSRHVWDLL